MMKEKLLNKAILYFTLHGWGKSSPYCLKCKYSFNGFPQCKNIESRMFLWFNKLNKKDVKLMNAKSSLRRSNPIEHQTYAAWCVKWLDDE